MSDVQQVRQARQAVWSLSDGEALSLTIGPGERELSVTEGRLWLTLQGRADAPAEDVWLQPGDSLRLASRSRVVIEGWPKAQFQLLVPPSACAELARQLKTKAAAFAAKPASSGLATA
jgi:hypothetical protein